MSEALQSTLMDRVLRILATEDFSTPAAGFDRRPLIERANSLGGPAMMLLHWEVLAQLRKIPRSTEGYAIDAVRAIDVFGADIVEIFMVSHRWLCPSVDPSSSRADSPGGEKARAINEFSRWRRQWVLENHGFLPEIYYWIDYCCIDQERSADAVPLLPLWVACCERFLRVETKDYDERAWCRLEPLLSFVFSFADHHVSIGLDFEFRWPHFGNRTNRPILDPTMGKVTNGDDMDLIRPLVDAAMRMQPAHHSRDRVNLGTSFVKCYAL